MQVSELLIYRDDLIKKLEQFSIDDAINKDKHILENLLGHHAHNPTFIKVEKAKDKLNELSKSLDSIKEILSEVLLDVNLLIDESAKTRFDQTEVDLFNSYFNFNFKLDDTVTQTIQACIHKNADHYYPALQFGCTTHSKIFTGDLVANDPLYLCDFNQENIENTSNQFNEIYNRRLRKYILDQHELHQLPHNQFGFILSWMVFNYANFTTVKHYLERMIRLLRPGGHLLFSYNNCDIHESCLVAEAGGMSYVSKRNLINFCKEIGYEIVNSYDMPNSDSHVKFISWLEIKKFGELTTAKRRQVLGAIHQK